MAAGAVLAARTSAAEKDISRLLTRSAWAKEVNAAFDISGMAREGGPGGGRMGGPGASGGGRMGGGMPGGGMGGPGGMPGGGMGGPGGMPGGGMGSPPQIKVLVRWESALPVREATNRKFPDGDAYIISVSGLGPLGGGRRPDAPQDASQQQEMESQLQETARLNRKGKDPIRAASVKIEESGQARVFLFMFPSGTQPIAAGDKEVTFVTRIGPLEAKAKFARKEMVYQGKLAL